MKYFHLFCLLLIFPLLPACGYNFAGSSPISMPGGNQLLHISLVNNPTQEAWLEPYLRSNFRDEFTRRGNVDWVPLDQAQALVQIDIHQFRTADSVSRERDKTVKASVVMTMEARIISAETGELIWSSGSVSGTSSYFLAAEDFSMPGTTGPEQRSASQDAVDQAITRIADRLGDVF